MKSRSKISSLSKHLESRSPSYSRWCAVPVLATYRTLARQADKEH